MTKKARLILIQEGVRRSHAVESASSATRESHPVAKRPGTFLFRSKAYELAQIEAFLRKSGSKLELESGEEFSLDAHGMWILSAEDDALFATGDPAKVKWITGVMPQMAPK